MPQYLVNRFAEEIASGETELALICGAELLRSTQNARKAGMAIDWNEDPGGEPTRIGDNRLGFSDEEARHELRAAIHFYPLLENAIRGGLKRDVREPHDGDGQAVPSACRRGEGQSAGDASRGLQRRAAGDDLRRQSLDLLPLPAADERQRHHRPGRRRADHFGRQGDANGASRRNAGCSCMAAPTARTPGSCRSATQLDTSPAIKGCARIALDMAGKTVADVSAFDLYSCFPSAVEVAMKEIGIAEDDPRPISVTGGLPFFGGPGNNYVTHSIAEMMNVVRAKPGSFGMVTANGNYLTKHSAGLYSTEPTKGPWRREDPKKLQAELDAAAEAAGEHGAERHRHDRDLLRRLRQGRARKEATSSAASTAPATASSP